MPASSMVELQAGKSFSVQPAAGGGYGMRNASRASD